MQQSPLFSLATAAEIAANTAILDIGIKEGAADTARAKFLEAAELYRRMGYHATAYLMDKEAEDVARAEAEEAARAEAEG